MLLKSLCLASALALSVLGEKDSDPIHLLRKKGIASNQLNEISSGLKGGDACLCSLACDTLLSIFSSDSVNVAGQESYDASQARYWSQQQARDTKPKCFIQPLDAEDVSVVVLVSRATECPFSVKGGGHTHFKGGSNSHGGITIDFIQRKHVIPSADRKSVAFGPGNTWVDVYTVLDNLNLTMVGGRTATVGVSGLILGGGISFFSGQYGWTCDNMINYEIVLASGEIVRVDSKSHPDLFWALRGGGGNFGIVTEFVAKAIEQGPMWGGFVFWEMHSTKDAVINGLVNYADKGAEKDPKAALILSFAYAQQHQLWLSCVMPHHSDPQPSGSHPEIFADFFGIENSLGDSTRTTSHSNLTIEVNGNNPIGLRQNYQVYTTYVDKQLALDILTIYHEEIEQIKNITGLLPALVYQIITIPQLRAMARAGGNALGISGGKKPLMLINFTVMWALDSDDEAVLTTSTRILSRIQTLTRQRGLEHPFLYMNYASQFQDPLSSYGTENKARLIEISKKYDPEGIFQKLSPGHFKFNGPPAAKW
ncbi:FAD-binding domain-containing protein [Hypoxylon trugodes]|uniref:FAD-binding domain-containing protein n=1 Tax=Hypoxylon trugodes TaxID=326681 RepID=UPI00219FD428|nr:FAD-binding domain-containing protein [Hypoxylon trugodes]KAI1387737.1 FAD-binding domain-containing protein [Hypoxylon trugodes]